MTDHASTGWTGGEKAFGDFAPGMVHLAFYAGWPNGMGAMTVAKNVFTQKEN